MSNLTRVTRRLVAPRESDFERGAACIFATAGTEARSRLAVWNDREKFDLQTCAEILTQDAHEVDVRLAGHAQSVTLKDPQSLRQLFLGRSVAYLDISGLGHHVWAPIVREGLQCLSRFWVVYAEPERYRTHSTPTSTNLFDLSSSILGLAPLPGFANLRGPADDAKSLFVPLLGFEGARAKQLAMSLDPEPRVIPVVGVPGFKIEFPFVTITCNQELLDDYNAHAAVRVARASCPFEAYDTLAEIRSEFRDSYMYLAPVGTKPHALGAICYAIDNAGTTEVMYDHPVRRPQRTFGVRDVHAYCLKDQ